MLYQLPNGKCVHLSIEEYLNLTHEDIQYLMAGDYGDHIVNPFKGSAIDTKASSKFYDFDEVNLTDEDIISNNGNPFDDITDLTDDLNT